MLNSLCLPMSSGCQCREVVVLFVHRTHNSRGSQHCALQPPLPHPPKPLHLAQIGGHLTVLLEAQQRSRGLSPFSVNPDMLLIHPHPVASLCGHLTCCFLPSCRAPRLAPGASCLSLCPSRNGVLPNQGEQLPCVHVDDVVPFSSRERHTIHLRQSGCPLETTAVFISQLTPCVVRVCVYLNLDF